MSNGEIIERVGVCGVGQMGAAAAACYKRAGFETILWDQDPSQLDRVPDRLDQLDAWMDQQLGKSENENGRYTIVRHIDDLDERADLVMDCIVEDMSEKVSLFSNLNSAVEREAILITTTSGLSITEMAKQSRTGPLLVGTHFWNPPHLMPLVEVIRGQETRDRMMDRVCDVMKSIGKIPVRVERDVPGFIGNRLLHAMWREALYLVQEGIGTPRDIDLVARMTFGLRMPAVGPLENMDLVGLDLIEKIHAYLMQDLSNDPVPLPILTQKLRDGNLGMKTGQGIYEWNDLDSQRLIEKRDSQIVHQLEFLKHLEGQ